MSRALRRKTMPWIKKYAFLFSWNFFWLIERSSPSGVFQRMYVANDLSRPPRRQRARHAERRQHEDDEQERHQEPRLARALGDVDDLVRMRRARSRDRRALLRLVVGHSEPPQSSSDQLGIRRPNPSEKWWCWGRGGFGKRRSVRVPYEQAQGALIRVFPGPRPQSFDSSVSRGSSSRLPRPNRSRKSRVAVLQRMSGHVARPVTRARPRSTSVRASGRPARRGSRLVTAGGRR